jgi:hypothetical protein
MTESNEIRVDGAISAANVAPGPDHRAVAPTAPNKAFWRTVLQVGPTSLVALVGILPFVIQDIVDGFGQHLPDGLRLWLLGASVTLTAASATLAKIMANVKVIEWTRKYAPFFAPQKQS